MDNIWQGFTQAWALISSADAGLISIIFLSLQVTLSAVFISSFLALPLALWLSTTRSAAATPISILLNSLMSLPPVVVGLLLYILLSSTGPFGALNMLFTPSAMILAQTIIILPLIASIANKNLQTHWAEFGDLLRSLRASKFQMSKTLIWEARHSLLVAVLAGFGRAIGEVGAVMIVGGNIEQATRVLTTAITLQTSRGDIPMALALGIILLILALATNILAHFVMGKKWVGTQ